jgi:hypothetical protein
MRVISDAIPDRPDASPPDKHASQITPLHEHLGGCAGEEDQFGGSRWKLARVGLEAAGVDFASADGAEDVGVCCLDRDFGDKDGAVFVRGDGSAIVFCSAERAV